MWWQLKTPDILRFQVRGEKSAYSSSYLQTALTLLSFSWTHMHGSWAEHLHPKKYAPKEIPFESDIIFDHVWCVCVTHPKFFPPLSFVDGSVFKQWQDQETQRCCSMRTLFVLILPRREGLTEKLSLVKSLSKVFFFFLLCKAFGARCRYERKERGEERGNEKLVRDFEVLISGAFSYPPPYSLFSLSHQSFYIPIHT